MHLDFFQSLLISRVNFLGLVPLAAAALALMTMRSFTEKKVNSCCIQQTRFSPAVLTRLCTSASTAAVKASSSSRFRRWAAKEADSRRSLEARRGSGVSETPTKAAACKVSSLTASSLATSEPWADETEEVADTERGNARLLPLVMAAAAVFVCASGSVLWARLALETAESVSLLDLALDLLPRAAGFLAAEVVATAAADAVVVTI